jgi:hypothetical protein
MDKREARKAYKSRVTPKGIFAVRCKTSGEVWVGASDHLDTAQNGMWFQLRGGLQRNPQLQAAWNAHGEAAFQYEVLEKFDEEVSPLLLGDLTKKRQKHWEDILGAARF